MIFVFLHEVTLVSSSNEFHIEYVFVSYQTGVPHDAIYTYEYDASRKWEIGENGKSKVKSL